MKMDHWGLSSDFSRHCWVLWEKNLHWPSPTKREPSIKLNVEHKNLIHLIMCVLDGCAFNFLPDLRQKEIYDGNIFLFLEDKRVIMIRQEMPNCSLSDWLKGLDSFQVAIISQKILELLLCYHWRFQ